MFSPPSRPPRRFFFSGRVARTSSRWISSCCHWARLRLRPIIRSSPTDGADGGGPLFRPVPNPGETLDRPLTGAAVYAGVLMHPARAAGTDPAAANLHAPAPRP